MSYHPLQIKALHYAPNLGLVYVNNQKAACTSVKYSLWLAEDQISGRGSFSGNTHDRTLAPFITGYDLKAVDDFSALKAAKVFTVVRNPFTRILSAYLHHIYDGSVIARISRKFGLWRSSEVRDRFCSMIGVSPRFSFSFKDFLIALQGADMTLISGHFRPQYFNISFEQLKYDHISHMEQPEVLSAFLNDNGVEYKRRATHAQNASAHLGDYYNSEAISLVCALFEKDFSLFGYDPNDMTKSAGPIAPSGQIPLVEFIDKCEVR